MDEIRQLTVEILEQLDLMSPDEIESMREEWLSALSMKDKEQIERVEDYVNAVCDVGIIRVMKRTA